MSADVGSRLGAEAARLFAQYLEKIEHCVGLLDEEGVWWRPNRASNSVGNLLLHLTGNLSQWVLAGLGGERYERHRSAEFEADRSTDPGALTEKLHTVVERCRSIAARLAPADLDRRLSIQGYERDGFGVLLHAVEHTAYHTGQIVLITKQLVGDEVEIEFYPHLKGR
jgi:uncharacterized damage-inducible protein DinB